MLRRDALQLAPRKSCRRRRWPRPINCGALPTGVSDPGYNKTGRDAKCFHERGSKNERFRHPFFLNSRTT